MQLKNKAKAIPVGRQGFTLIELLVVMAIIGVLAGLIMVNFNSARERTRDTQRKSDLAQIGRSLMMYHNDFGNYPETTATGNAIAGCLPAGTADCDWGGAWDAAGGDFYMKILPEDPYSGQDYSYDQNGDHDFCLWATLENNSDSSIASSQARCSDCNPLVAGNNYVVCAD